MNEIRDRLIEAAVNLGESLGLNRTVCQIYAFLYLSDQPLSPTEIGKTLGMSKGNVSINLRILEQWNAVRKVWKKGYTRPLYVANEDIEEIVMNKLKSGLEKRLNYVKPLMNEIKKSRAGFVEKKFFDEKLEKIEKLISKIEFLLNNIETVKLLTK
ncbi:MAG: MarR family transcriptional regulator [Candidatus Omnitrophica bacterium]|nr:MarR family transcriptional regulator [Candidatus Omnitrophota bacterium]